ncbi:hypothetical protein [Trinickia sp. EG282A]|uniref:hypothetical protein n=1 Tax=Trinickia sp. EG282A TaxID=3237013 RepID=UPI0034D29E33
MRHLPFDPDQSLAQAIEHRFPLRLEDSVMLELVREFSRFIAVLNLDRAGKTTGYRIDRSRNRPIAVADPS